MVVVERQRPRVPAGSGGRACAAAALGARPALARLRDADQAADHVAAGADRGVRDGRRGAAARPALAALMALVIGGGLACGGASALNHVLDRDIDRLMGRAPRRARSPPGGSRPRRAVAFGLVLLALSFAVMTAFDNLLAAALALAEARSTSSSTRCWLKRTTPQNIVIGGAAGAIPTLSGWAAANGHLGHRRGLPVRDRAAVDAAALLGARAAARAPLRRGRIPMMPVVRGAAAPPRGRCSRTRSCCWR